MIDFTNDKLHSIRQVAEAIPYSVWKKLLSFPSASLILV